VSFTLQNGAIAGARVALTGIGDAAFRSGVVERALVGVRPSDAAAVKAACAGASAGVEARSDTFASASYRTAMADIFTARAVERAATRA
jgi:carbon-monoxide dehydrogenase medium subunit